MRMAVAVAHGHVARVGDERQCPRHSLAVLGDDLRDVEVSPTVAARQHFIQMQGRHSALQWVAPEGSIDQVTVDDGISLTWRSGAVEMSLRFELCI